MAGILVLVPGSVEEERPFSKLAFIKDVRHNYLQALYLNACLVLATQRMWEFTDFLPQGMRLAVHIKKSAAQHAGHCAGCAQQ